MKQKLHYLFTLVSLLAVSTAWAKDFSGAELYTLEEVQYGKFEARMMMAAASGTVSSMFLYQNGSEIDDGRPWVEVDMEVLGKAPGRFQTNIITGKAGAQKTSEKNYTISPAADQAFHTYAIEWTPTYVRWTVDGQEVRKTEGGQVSDLTGTQGLHFNLWSSESVEWVLRSQGLLLLGLRRRGKDRQRKEQHRTYCRNQGRFSQRRRGYDLQILHKTANLAIIPEWRNREARYVRDGSAVMPCIRGYEPGESAKMAKNELSPGFGRG